MFFVAGITGRVGGAAATALLDEGRQVRTLVRDPRKAAAWAERGVDVREGDLADGAALAGALEGVEAAFIMQPTPFAVSREFPEAHALIAGVRDALDRAPPPRLVILSSVGSEQTSGLGNITQTHMLEDALAAAAFPVAFVRPGGFLENNLQGFGRAADTGVFDSFLQPVDRSFPMAATADIGAEVARLLASQWEGRKVVELGSRFTPQDLAEAMGEVLGKPVRAQAVPRETWEAVLGGMGVPPDKVGNWTDMQDGFNSGWIDFGRPGTESVAGATTPAQVFRAARKG